ncbi:MAG: hypothetical protein N2320_05525 [Candidatus Bipolaricaulota bacterium]|nr:hypothetical protein [Candidatus Bipolaricaulota bacterium]
MRRCATATRTASRAGGRPWQRWRRSSGRTVRPWALVPALLGLALLTFLLRDLAAALLDGVLRVLWFIDALPQALVWGALVLALLFLTSRLGGKGRRRARPARQEAVPTWSELAELTGLVRDCDRSPAAQRVLAERLGRIAVALRVRREALPAGQAWEELEAGRWPPDPTLRAVLRPGRRPVPTGYRKQLAQAVDKLWLYAQGGQLDDR